MIQNSLRSGSRSSSQEERSVRFARPVVSLPVIEKKCNLSGPVGEESFYTVHKNPKMRFKKKIRCIYFLRIYK